jgi:hypothetical protein
VISGTLEHPFWVEGEGWTAAKELKAGSELLTKEGCIARVEAVSRREGKFKVYNFEVERLHTYFVSRIGILVHNQCAAGTEERIRGLWQITKEGTDAAGYSERFGSFFRHKTTGLWWAKDTAGHGGSVWKVFQETKKGLKWIADADKYGDFIVGKHKSPTGTFIPWGDLH